MRLRIDNYVDIVKSGDPAVWARPAGLAELGPNSYFAEPYVIRSPQRVYVGDEVRVDRGAVLSLVASYGDRTFDPVVRIGSDVMIGTDLHLHCAGRIEIGDRAAIAARVYIGDSFRDYDDPTLPPAQLPMADPEPVRICEDVFIGAGAAVLPGVTVGKRAIVAAGSVLTRDVPPLSVVFGNPARVVRSWDEHAGEWVAGPPRSR